jgi:release factor glutamine methyltransferase
VTLFEVVLQARETLARAGISASTAALDADLLARHVLGWDRARWLERRTETADDEFSQAYAALITRRGRREPVAYIRGVQEFWGREFLVTPDVLIPRPDTELVVELAAAWLNTRSQASVVDVGTGSGCIAISLALDCPHAIVWATDVSGAALRVAAANAVHLNAVDRVRFVQGSYLAGVPRPIDVVVSNPPYVAEHDAAGLAPEVVGHEPGVALFGGADGLHAARVLLQEASTGLAPDGRLFMEIGFGQYTPIEAAIADVAGLSLIEIRHDLQGIPRVVVAKRYSISDLAI